MGWRPFLRVIRGIRGRRRLPIRLVIIGSTTVITLVRRWIAVARLRPILIIALLGLVRLDGPSVNLPSHGTNGAA